MNLSTRDARFQQALLALTFLLTAAGLYMFGAKATQAGLLFVSRRVTAISSTWLLLCLALLGITIASLTPARSRLESLGGKLFSALSRLRRLNLVLFALLLAIYNFLVLGSFGQDFNSTLVRASLLWLTTLAGFMLLKAANLGVEQHKTADGVLFAFALLAGAAVYRMLAYLPEITPHPFTLDWSEASRYYYASLYFSRQIYGFDLSPTVLHPSRYLMQALPFLLPGSPLWLHRLWQVLLWVTVTTLTSWLLARRLNLPDPYKRWALIAWAFLFLLVGPVYYHLQVPVIIVLAGFRKDRFWLSTASVLAASLWAGISRINWFPVPGMLAATLYLLEVPLEGRATWRYLLPPTAWGVLGTLAAFASQAIYAVWSGNSADQFTSSLTSDLLWYRLLPNPTYPIGVLPGAILVCLPMAGLIYGRLKSTGGSYHWLRLAGTGAMLLVLFAGGLVVSTKIGGGSNLHNLDAFLALLMLVLAYVYFEKQTPEPGSGGKHIAHARWWGNAGPVWQALAFALVLLVSIYPNLAVGGPRVLPGADETELALRRINWAVSPVAENGGEVLFIAERQLLTFGIIGDVKLVPDYERVFLMEMAMAGNPDYLNRFHQELKSHRFDVIISEPLITRYKGPQVSFGEENDAWVRNVSRPVLCYYEIDRTMRSVSVQILIPRQERLPDCP